MNVKEKLIAIQRSAAFSANNFEPVTEVKTKDILAIAAEFLALERRALKAEGQLEADGDMVLDAQESMREWRLRAEAAEAKMVPDGWEVCSPGWIERNGPCSCGEAPRIAFGNMGPHYHPKSLARSAPAVNLGPVSNCLSFFASVIKSGESWSETCQRDLDAARDTLRNIEEAQ